MRERETAWVYDEWIIYSLAKFIRLGNFVDYQDNIPQFREIPRVNGEFDPKTLETRTIDPDLQESFTDKKILSVFLNGRVRRGNLVLIDAYWSNFIERIEKRTAKAEPINIVLPTLPFKDQNPLTTRLPLDTVDLGEYLFMAQIRDIIRSVGEIYPPGLRFTILTDGLVYADIFANGEKAKIKAYRQNCETVADALELKDLVSFIDMFVVVNNQPGFFESQKDFRDILRYLQERDNKVKERMRSLRWGMLVNIPSLGYTYNDFKTFLTLPEEELPKDVRERITEASLDYASFALAMDFLQCIDAQFPDDLRATVHPKNAPQIPIHLVDRSSIVFPYNGVPVISEDKLSRTGSLRRSARIIRYCDVLQYPEAKAVFLPGGDNPFYYLVPEHKKLE